VEIREDKVAMLAAPTFPLALLLHAKGQSQIGLRGGRAAAEVSSSSTNGVGVSNLSALSSGAKRRVFLSVHVHIC
jgi:hypothetical protein